MDKRPDLNSNISVKDFTDFYWLKAELIDFCKKEGLPRSGNKIEIANRISTFLKTGKKEIVKQKKTKPISKFDWNNEPLSLKTIITDNYKNSENVRAFFQKHTKRQFKFNVRFMNWMKANVGKTLHDALQQWETLEIGKKTTPKDIAPQFEYNRYTRDFLADNPNLTKADAIRFWKIKRSMRGGNGYERSDLELK